MYKMVVPVDGSKLAEAALTYAKELAGRTSQMPAMAQILPSTKLMDCIPYPASPPIVKQSSTAICHLPSGCMTTAQSDFSNISLVAPHTGHTQSAGSSSKGTPGLMPPSRSPSAGS